MERGNGLIWVIGTSNADKFAEIVEILKPTAVQFVPVSNWNVKEPIESGKTLLENAQIKSRYYHQITKHLCIADDTGLFVDLLGGEPGVYAARYAGPNASDQENRKKLLEKLKPFPKPWKAYFETVVSVTWNDGEWLTNGKVFGQIISEERGEFGFGYDPIFIPDGYQKTFAEMNLVEKNKISHRYLALQNVIDAVKNNLLPIK